MRGAQYQDVRAVGQAREGVGAGARVLLGLDDKGLDVLKHDSIERAPRRVPRPVGWAWPHPFMYVWGCALVPLLDERRGP